MATAPTPGGAAAQAGSEKKLQPIIIKRVKKQDHGVHGGAWKIAYADFVTAMMAFFLLMWLLGSTAEGDLQGIAAYFKSPLKVTLQGGSSTGNSSTVIPSPGNDIARIHGQIKRSEADETVQRKQMEARARRAQQDAQRLRALRAKIDAVIASNAMLNEYRSQIRLDIIPDGLQIQIVDEQKRPMFDIGSAVIKPYMREILYEVGSALVDVENRISLAGHTDAAPYGSGERGYSNWELSADRANASRRELVSAGMPIEKLARVVGLSSTDLLIPEEPRAAQNRRITLTVLTHEAEERLLGKTPPAVLEQLQQLQQQADNPDNSSSSSSSSSPNSPDSSANSNIENQAPAAAAPLTTQQPETGVRAAPLQGQPGQTQSNQAATIPVSNAID